MIWGRKQRSPIVYIDSWRQLHCPCVCVCECVCVYGVSHQIYIPEPPGCDLCLVGCFWCSFADASYKDFCRIFAWEVYAEGGGSAWEQFIIRHGSTWESLRAFGSVWQHLGTLGGIWLFAVFGEGGEGDNIWGAFGSVWKQSPICYHKGLVDAPTITFTT